MRFGDAPAPWTALHSPNLLVALAPPGPALRNVSVTVALPGEPACGAAPAPFYYAQSAAPRFNPAIGGLNGGTAVAVDPPDVGRVVACLFAGVRVPARSSTAGVPECVTPPAHAGAAPFAVVLADGEQRAADEPFWFVDEIEIASVRPTAGVPRGGTLVAVAGRGFVDTPALSCRFGGAQMSRAVFGSSSLVTCASPAAQEGFTTVHVSNNALDFTPSSAAPAFLVVPPHTLDGVLPARVDLRGPAVGVTVVGQGFPEADDAPLECVFGTARTPAATTVRLSSTALRCVVPPLHPGNYTVNVLAGAEEAPMPLPVMLVMNPALLFSASPSAGPARGGTAVALAGAHFEPACDHTCRFGARAVPAARVSASLLRCVSPPLALGEVPLSAACAGGAPIPGPALAFTALDVAAPLATQLRKLRPRSGPRAGGTPVALRGDGLASAKSCGFGENQVPAEYDLAADELRCRAPPAAVDGPALVYLLSADGQVISRALEFVYYAPPELARVEPAAGCLAGLAAVTIRGAGFSTAEGGACRFGALVVPAVPLSSAAVRCVLIGQSPTASAAPAAEVDVAFAANEVDFVSESALRFNNFVPARVLRVVPTQGATVGGTPVTIVSSGLNYAGSALSATVQFGTSDVDAHVVSSSEIVCSAPAHSRGLVTATLTVANGCVSGPESNFTFQFVDVATITKLVPSSGLPTQDAIVTVIGAGFRGNGSVACRFGARTSTLARLQSASAIVCVAPTLAPGRHAVEVTDGSGSHFTSSGLHTVFEPLPGVVSAEPSALAARSPQLVVVSGTDFLARDTLCCRFGRLESSPARFLSHSRVECRAPALAPGNLSLEVSNDGHAFSRSAAVLAVRPTVTLARVFPTRGPAAGGTTVTLEGDANALEDVLCRVGGLTARAARVSATAVVCRLPLRAPGPASVQLVAGDGHALTEAVALELYPDPSVTALVPALASALGGCPVTVLGRDFQQDGATVSFGGAVAQVTFVSSSMLLCTAPAASENGKVSVEVSLNGVDLTRSGKTLVYWPHPRVSSIEPSVGAQWGGSEVTVMGEHFSGMLAVWCRFGSTGGTVVGTLVSGSMVTCKRPAYLSGSVTIELSNNGVEYSEDGFVYTVSTASVRTIWPTRGDASGGTVLTLGGTGLDGVDELTCEFVSGSTVGTRTEAAWTCSAPRSDELGETSMRVVSGGQELDNGLLRYEYTPSSTVKSVVPSSGSMSGQYTVTVRGEGFMMTGTSVCMFSGQQSAGRVMSTSEVECVVPNTTLPGDVQVGVSSNGVDVSAGSATFVYRPMARLVAVSPSLGADVGGTVVTVWVEGVTAEEALECSFGSTGKWVQMRGLECDSPAAKSGGNVTLSVKRAGETSMIGALPFMYVSTQSVRSVRPSRGSMRGGTVVEIALERSTRPESFSCVIGSHTAAGRYSGSGNAVCEMPTARTSGPVQVLLRYEHETVSGATFEYREEIRVEQMFPTQGLTTGGEEVLITGSGFPADGGMGCKFGAVMAAAAVQEGTTAVRCRSPAMPAGTVSVSLSDNGVDFSSDSVLFFAALVSLPEENAVDGDGTSVLRSEPLEVKSVLPCHISTRDGVLLELTGVGFTPNSRCVFADVQTDAVFVSAHELTCKTPPLSAGAMELRVASNGVLSASFELTVHPRAEIFALAPSVGHAGAALNVRVAGAHFFLGGDAACSLGGSRSIAATVLSSSALLCHLPPARDLGFALLEVSCDGVAFSSEGRGVDTLAPLVVSGLLPSAVPLGAAVAAVTVTGSPFPESDGWSCSVGVTRTAATWTPAGVVCALAGAALRGNESVAVSLDGATFFAAPAALAVLPRLRLDFTAPSAAPPRGGGFVTLSGALSGPLDPRAWHCSFGGALTPAQRLGPERARCGVPDHAPARVALALVRGEGGELLSNTLAFEFLPGVEILGASPSLGPASGGTSVTVRAGGAPLRAGTLCVFGEGAAPVPAARVNATAAECVAPAGTPGPAAVSLVSGGARSLGSGAEFLFVAHERALALQPSAVAAGAAAAVTVRGEGFLDVPSLACFVGRASAAGAWRSSREVECAVPAAPAGLVEVRVANNGALESATPALSLVRSAERAVTRVAPSVALAAGGLTVVLHGLNLADAPGPVLVGPAAVPFASVNASAGTLQLPATAPGLYPVRFRAAAARAAVPEDAPRVRYIEGPAIRALQPTAGPAAGGTRVTVSGSGFPADLPAQCAFGAAPLAAATFVSSSQLVCTSPALAAGHRATSLPVEVTYNGVELSTSGLRLHLFVPATVRSIVPSSAVASARQTVTVFGAHFPAAPSGATALRFGLTDPVPLAVVTSSMATCVVPRIPGGRNVTVDVSSYGYGSADPGVPFALLEERALLSVQPSRASAAGGALLTVIGRRFSGGDQVVCDFAWNSSEESFNVAETPASAPRAVSAAVQSGGVAVCACPAAPAGAARLVVEISVNGTALRPLATVELHSPAAVELVSPGMLFGPASEQVTVVGSNFAPSTAAVCVFASVLGHAPVRAAATVLSSTQVSCAAPPPLDASSGERLAVVVLAASGEAAEGQVYLERLPLPVLTRVVPDVAFSAPGQLIALEGKHLAPRTGAACVFLGAGGAPDEVVPARAASASRLECTVPYGREGVVMVRAGTLADDVLSEHVALTLLREPVASGAVPLTGSLMGGTEVRFVVAPLAQGAAYWCRFGDALVDATATDDGELRCKSPPASSPGSIPLAVGYRALGAEGAAGAVATFAYHAPVTVSAVHPSRASATNGAVLTVTGSFPEAVAVDCVLASAPVGPAWLVSSSQIICSVPAQPVGTASLHLTTNGADYIEALDALVFEHGMRITSVLPTASSISAASVVTVFGSGFVDSDDLRCCVGLRDSFRASFMSSHVVTCQMSNVRHASGNVSISVGDSGTCCPSNISKQFVASNQVKEIWPSCGPSAGGTRLTLTLLNESSTAELPPMVCDFRGQARAIVERSGRTFICVVPHLPVQVLELSVRTIAENLVLLKTDFKVYESPIVSDLQPALVSSSGGCPVTVLGRDFQQDGATVSFGGAVAQVTFVSSSMLLCTAPAASENGKVSVEVSLNGVDLTRSGKTLVYWPHPRVSSIEPSVGAQWGGSEVTVMGEHFSGMLAVWCRFGSTGGTVVGTLVSGSMVTCKRPAYLSGSVTIELSNNGVEYSEDGFVYTVSTASVRTIWPTRGDASGGTVLTLGGTGLDGVDELTCEFVSGSTVGTRTEAAWTCSAPRSDELGETSMRVVSGGQELDNGLLRYEYTPSSTVKSVVPSSGSMSGKYTVTVRGEGFMMTGTSVCMFSGQQSAGRVMSTSEVECVVPNTTLPGDVQVGVSSNGVDVSAGSATFVYRPMARLVAVSPSLGADVGGTVVTVWVEGVTAEEALECSFGSTGKWVQMRGLECDSPAAKSGGNVTLSVKRAGETSMIGALPFMYVSTQSVRSVRPSRGSMRGGTVVEIALERSTRPESFSCVIGSHTAAGRYSEVGQCGVRDADGADVGARASAAAIRARDRVGGDVRVQGGDPGRGDVPDTGADDWRGGGADYGLRVPS